MFSRSAWLLSALLCIETGSVAMAQTPLPVPTPIVVPTLPPSNPTQDAIVRAAAGILQDVIARSRANAANTTHGNVTYFRRFDMQVQTGTNAYRTVRLHQGTVINPRGATPGVGTTVDVSGQGASDGALDAAMITVVH